MVEDKPHIFGQIQIQKNVENPLMLLIINKLCQIPNLVGSIPICLVKVTNNKHT